MVGIVAAGQRGLRIVHGCLDRAGDDGTHAVCTDDDGSRLRNHCAASGVATDARHAVAVNKDLLYPEAFPQLSASLNGCVDEDFVKHFAPWGVTMGDIIDGRT